MVHYDLELVISYENKTVTVKGIGNNYIYKLSDDDNEKITGMFEK